MKNDEILDAYINNIDISNIKWILLDNKGLDSFYENNYFYNDECVTY